MFSGTDVVLFIPSSVVVPVVVFIVGFGGVVSSYVVVSLVEIAINFVALVLVAIVVSVGVIKTNCVELTPSALVILGTKNDIKAFVMLSAVVPDVVIRIGVVTCAYKNRKIKHKTFKTIYNS